LAGKLSSAYNFRRSRKAGETVKVTPGHFRNHLMPKMLAVPSIDKFAILMREQPKVRFFLDRVMWNVLSQFTCMLSCY
jgi:hypothetical protein